MPFRKVGKNDYVSPSGRHFNEAQVRLWHANGNKFPGQKESEMASYKGGGPVSTSYAAGGPVLGRTRSFMKEPDPFREPDDKGDHDQLYGKTGPGKGDGCYGSPAVKQNKRIK